MRRTERRRRTAYPARSSDCGKRAEMLKISSTASYAIRRRHPAKGNTAARIESPIYSDIIIDAGNDESTVPS